MAAKITNFTNYWLVLPGTMCETLPLWVLTLQEHFVYGKRHSPCTAGALPPKKSTLSPIFVFFLGEGASVERLQSWTKVLGHFCISDAFPSSHRPNPSPLPHKQSLTRVSRIFSEFQFSIGWGEGELQENFEKGALFYEGTQKWQKSMNTALLSQGLLSTIVVKTIINDNSTEFT